MLQIAILFFILFIGINHGVMAMSLAMIVPAFLLMTYYGLVRN